MSSYSIEVGEVVDVLRGFNDCSFDALMCDPPYGFSFMGKAWDYSVPSVDLWRECLRVLKPGAPLVAFGGSRTYHRLACGIEDAGFELRDCLMWLYGKGFPKSQNIGLAIDNAAGATRAVLGAGAASCPYIARGEKCPGHGDVGRYGETVHAAATAPATELARAWHGYGTALKPAHEPIVLARRPLDGTTAQNVARWGVGGLAIDACRIADDGTNVKWTSPRGGIWTTDPDAKAELVGGGGRWPANLILDEVAAAILDAEAGDRPSAPYRENTAGGNVLPFTKRTAGGYSDSGGPSRFFYCSKVSTKEREAGCESLPKKSAGEATERSDACNECEGVGSYLNIRDERVPCIQCSGLGRAKGLDNPRAGAGRTGGARNFHPTLKPISLTTWLARLVMPPTPGVILVPFAGAGSEMIGALKAGWGGVFGIEREADYARIARARLGHWCPESEAA